MPNSKRPSLESRPRVELWKMSRVPISEHDFFRKGKHFKPLGVGVLSLSLVENGITKCRITWNLFKLVDHSKNNQWIPNPRLEIPESWPCYNLKMIKTGSAAYLDLEKQKKKNLFFFFVKHFFLKLVFSISIFISEASLEILWGPYIWVLKFEILIQQSHEIRNETYVTDWSQTERQTQICS